MGTNWAARTVLVLLVVLSVVLLAMIIRPFMGALFIAAVLAGALEPGYARLTRLLKGRREVAALILTLGVLVAVVLPLASLGAVVIHESLEAIAFVRSTLQSDGAPGLLEFLPSGLRGLGQRVLGALPSGVEALNELVTAQGGTAFAAVGGVLQAGWQAVFQTTMALIALYFFLVDGGALVAWADQLLRFRHVKLQELLNEFRRVSVTVLVSSLATAGAQTVVATVGYAIARVPSLLVFTMLTFILALIPAVGATVMSLALAILVYLSGRPGSAIFLAAWGIIVVGLVDNVVKPYLIKGGMALHGAVVFFALLGGLAVFGFAGLLAGPLIVAFFLAIVPMARRELGGDGSAR